jgi:hypothetical protein
MREIPDPYLHPYTLSKKGPELVLRVIKWVDGVKLCWVGDKKWVAVLGPYTKEEIE